MPFTNPERRREYLREWKKLHPGYDKNNYLVHRKERLEYCRRHAYGLLPEDYQRLFESQLGRCAICGKELTSGHGTNVDHDPRTKKVRGLLCNRCNLYMAPFDAGFAPSALQYLIEVR